ncbi:hypothetical protein CAC42_7109 [Sphaceloma murrayae]|uniref:Uncharacterized protein n=1 Tax=Sphaceloma murrayae TaxID=2082308 RepID=A0A2K1QQR2_9PEZI|nr:hypothetical protein CAC42_7109 [Sphaceloma murrayae]
MIRRKFSFNFRETFGSGKTEQKGSKGPVYSDEYSPPPSPHAGRREPLPARLEVDLRLACAGIVNNTIPSDAYVENPYEDLGRPQLDYTAVRSNSETARQRSMSGSKHTRNFSNPAANLEFPDFPIPGPVDRSKYAYKPDTALKDLFAVPDRTHFTSLVDRSRRRAESISSLDKQGVVQKTPTGRQASRSFSVASNLPLNQPPVRPKQVRRALSQDADGSTLQTDYSEFPLSDSTAPAQTTVTSRRAKYASYHAPARVDAELDVLKEVDRGRQRKSWYKPFASDEEQEPGQGRTRSQSRARSISQGIQEYIRPGSSRDDSRGASRQRSRAGSTSSRRSSASSGVLPSGKSLFRWKSWRQSINSWRDSQDLDLDGAAKLNKRKSAASLKNRKSVNLNRELPPLPSLDQWKGEEVQEISLTPLEPAESPLPEKPKHIAALWNKAAAKRKSVEFKKSNEVKKEYRKSMGPPSRTTVDDRSKKMEYRKSYSDFTYAHPRIPVSQFESPILPHVMAQMSPPPLPKTYLSPKVHRKPVPLNNKSTPTDSVMDDQDVNNAPPVLKPEDIGIAKTTPDLTLIVPPAPPMPPPAVPAAIAEVRSSAATPAPVVSPSSVAGGSVYATPAEIVTPDTKSAPAEGVTPAAVAIPKGDVTPAAAAVPIEDVTPAAVITPVSATDGKLKRRSGNYSWLPPEQEYRDMSPISRSASVSAKRRSGNYSWLPPETVTSLADKRRSWIPPSEHSMTSTPDKRRSGNYSWVPPPDNVTSLADKRRSWMATSENSRTSTPDKRRSWIVQVDEEPSPPVTDKRRPTKLELQQPTSVPSAIPKRLMDRQEDPATGEVQFVSRQQSIDAFNQLQSPKYLFADDISALGSPPPVPPKDPIKKARWIFGKKKPTTWMDEMEKLGIKDGLLLTDQLNGAPIVRY